MNPAEAPGVSWTGQIHPAAELFPMASAEELAGLTADIAEHGLREACWVAADGSLLDGRNRVEACKRAQVEPRFRTYDGDDPIGFVLSLNLHRRHLTPGQCAMLALKVVPLYEAEAARRRAHGQTAPGRTLGADRPEASKRASRSRDKAGAATKSSGRAVARAKRVAEAAPDLAEQVEAGDLALDRADRIVRDREAEKRRIEQARQQAMHLETGTRIDIRHGDFREVLADLTGIDAIITDPPYPREYLPLLADLAAWADKALAPDGILAVLFGQTYLPEVYRLLDGGRPYRWTMAYLTPGPAYASHAARTQSSWKPVLVYGGGPRFGDVIRSEGTDAHAKQLHHWGQDHGAFHSLVERLTLPGQTVVDPFMGSGTTLAAAHALGRHAIGCDIDEAHVATARERLG